jgi:hypothetical protein
MRDPNTTKAAPALAGNGFRKSARLAGESISKSTPNPKAVQPVAPADAPKPNREIRDGRSLLGFLAVRQRQAYVWDSDYRYRGVFETVAGAIDAVKQARLKSVGPRR